MKTLPVFRTLLILLILVNQNLIAQDIPLPEHPRPDFERLEWQNLNGIWKFQFDSTEQGLDEAWFEGNVPFNNEINVPFPWGSELSGVDDEADIAWYNRKITVDPSWKGKRVFITIGASDWKTDVWIDGNHLGTHKGGYVPFSFELTNYVDFGNEQNLVIRVDDKRRDFTLYGKQGYGNARGIWQTPYLEARGGHFIENIHFTPDIDNNEVHVKVFIDKSTAVPLPFSLNISTPEGVINRSVKMPAGKQIFEFTQSIPDPRLWNLDDPYLYEVTAILEEDQVKSYFGMRKISVVDLPGTEYPYIALNDKPVYMQLTLDQSYHPEGFYTFPDDQFIKDEILRSKSIGLNGIRTHIKVEVPRKLFWADKLGLLVMEDLPNSWGEPGEKMQAESEYTLREMIHRDYNHPSIISWVVFNETWGLFTSHDYDLDGNTSREYLPETQLWVASMYYLAKSLDQTRLVEDNSICCGRGHTETDINSWHEYLPGWEWDAHLKALTEKTFEGSTFHFEEGFSQGRQPNINSECGNVWGYDGSTGDVDWSYDYHRMMNSFRMYPEVSGWLYTEHHDVINEWNGYWRFDRSEKYTGMEQLCDGMNMNDLHSDVYLSTGNEICKSVPGGEKVTVPLFISIMTGKDFGENLTVNYVLEHTNYIGETQSIKSGNFAFEYTPWMQKELVPLKLTMAASKGLSVLKLKVTDEDGNLLQRNFMHFEITSGDDLPGISVVSVTPGEYSGAEWSKKTWDVMEGSKVNGTGKGYFDYKFAIPSDINASKIKELKLVMELSAKELFVKDMKDYNTNQDFMLGSQVAPSANPNSYPMTDEKLFQSRIKVKMNGEVMLATVLPDDPADHRGVLSWHHQLKDRKLREAGSYGYLIEVPVNKKQIKSFVENGSIEVRIETEDEGGIAVYGKEMGRYPLDPTLVFKIK